MFIYRLYTYSITLTYIEIWHTSYDMCKLHVYFSYVEYPRLTISLFWWWVSPIPKSWDINPSPCSHRMGCYWDDLVGFHPAKSINFVMRKWDLPWKIWRGNAHKRCRKTQWFTAIGEHPWLVFHIFLSVYRRLYIHIFIGLLWIICCIQPQPMTNLRYSMFVSWLSSFNG